MRVTCFLKLLAAGLVFSLIGYVVQPFLGMGGSPVASTFATGLLLGTLLGGVLVALNPRKQDEENKLDGHVLYVGNVPFNAREDELQRLFEAYGEVKAIRLVTSGPKQRPKGYGFVEMDAAGAEAAIALNGKEFAGRKLRVNPAKNRDS